MECIQIAENRLRERFQEAKTKFEYSDLLILTTSMGLLTRKDCLRLNLGGIPLINLKI